jgi:hypothetical protein
VSKIRISFIFRESIKIQNYREKTTEKKLQRKNYREKTTEKKIKTRKSLRGVRASDNWEWFGIWGCKNWYECIEKVFIRCPFIIFTIII